MGAENSRPEGFDFLDSGALPPRCAGASPISTSSPSSAISSAAIHRNIAIQNNADKMQSEQADGMYVGVSSEDFLSSFHHDSSNYTSSSSSGISNIQNLSSFSSGAKSRTEVLEKQQDERRFLMMFELFKLCENDFVSSLSSENENIQNSNNNNNKNNEKSSKKIQVNQFEAEAVKWSSFSLLRACRNCQKNNTKNTYCPKFRHQCLTGSDSAMTLLCDDCQAAGGAAGTEAVNATVDSVAAAIARFPGFSGSAVTGNWQLPVTAAAFAALSSTSSSSVTSTSSVTTHLHHHPSSSSSSASSIHQSGRSSESHSTTTTTVTTNHPAVRFLVNALLNGFGPISVVQGVSGTASETCNFASLLPGVEFVALATTCNQRENDLEQVRLLFRDRPNLQITFEGRSFDDKTLMFFTSAVFSHRISHLNVQHCETLTAAGFKLIATCFSGLKSIDFRGSSNIDLDAFGEPFSEDSPNILELLVDNKNSSSSSDEKQQQQQQNNNNKNPLTETLETLNFGSGALSLESRLGVLGRLRKLSDLNLSGCDCISDSSIIDFCRVSTFCWALDDVHVLPGFLLQQQEKEKEKEKEGNNNNFLLTTSWEICSPQNCSMSKLKEYFTQCSNLRLNEIENFVSCYSDLFYSSSNNNTNNKNNNNQQIQKIKKQHHKKNAAVFVVEPKQHHPQRFFGLETLNLTGLKGISDLSIRWLCSCWISPSEFQTRLQSMTSDFQMPVTSLLPAASTTTQMHPNIPTAVAAAAIAARQQQQQQRNENRDNNLLSSGQVASICAEKFCLLNPRIDVAFFENDSGMIVSASSRSTTTTTTKSPRTARSSSSRNTSQSQQQHHHFQTPRTSSNTHSMTATPTTRREEEDEDEADSHHRTPSLTATPRFQSSAAAVSSLGESPQVFLLSSPTGIQDGGPSPQHNSATFQKVSKILEGLEEEDENENKKSSSSIKKVFPKSWLASSLTSLSISECTGISADGIALIVTSFPNLTFFDLSKTNCNDWVLDLITTNCRNTSSSENIDNNSNININNNNLYHIQNHSTLPQLRELHIDRCENISCFGVCRFLKKMPKISSFSCAPFCGLGYDDEENEENDFHHEENPAAVAAASHDDHGVAVVGDEHELQQQEIKQMAYFLRRATLTTVNTLGIADPDLALATIKLLGSFRRCCVATITNNKNNINSQQQQQQPFQGSLRELLLPSMDKLTTSESYVQVSENAKEGRIIPNHSLSRISMTSVMNFLRDSLHQPSCDLVYHHVF